MFLYIAICPRELFKVFLCTLKSIPLMRPPFLTLPVTLFRHPPSPTLSSDPSYVIPEEERMNPARKRLQMLALEEAIFNVKMDFNGRFLALREVKKKVRYV